MKSYSEVLKKINHTDFLVNLYFIVRTIALSIYFIIYKFYEPEISAQHAYKGFLEKIYSKVLESAKICRIFTHFTNFQTCNLV